METRPGSLQHAAEASREEEFGLDRPDALRLRADSAQGGLSRPARDLDQAHVTCFEARVPTCRAKAVTVSGAKRTSPPGAAAGRATCL